MRKRGKDTLIFMINEERAISWSLIWERIRERKRRDGRQSEGNNFPAKRQRIERQDGRSGGREKIREDETGDRGRSERAKERR